MADETQGSGGAGDILYSGTYANGIVLNNPVMQNPATIAVSGLVTNAGTAIYGEPGAAWTVANYGTVEGGGTHGAGIVLKSGGLVENGASGLIAGYGSAPLTSGIEITGTAPVASTGTVVNNGTVKGGVSLSFFGSYYGNPASLGVVINSGSIAGPNAGVSIDAGDGTILNHGIITGTFSGAGISLSHFDTADPTGTIVNFGTIAGGKYSVGAAASVINYGQLDGGFYGPGLFGGVTVLNNYGTIGAANKVVAYTLINSGTIVSGGTSAYGSSYVINSGVIENAVGYGISLNSFPTVYLANSQTGLIEGAYAGAAVRDVTFNASQTLTPSGTVVNYGTIEGYIGLQTTLTAGGTLVGGTTVANAGTIVGTGGTAVAFAGDTDLMIVDPGAVFRGAVVGYGSALELAGYEPGRLNGLGVKFTGFTMTYVDYGAAWRLAGAGSDHRIVNDGTIAVYGEVITQGQLVSDPGYKGLVSLDPGGVAKFAGAVSADETVAFTGAGGEMDLARPLGFAGTIGGFGAGDTIDLLHNAADGLSFADSHLIITNQGVTVADLTFSGNYAAADFALSPDNHGGTDITFAVDAAPLLAMKG
jgi:hypothetical protein